MNNSIKEWIIDGNNIQPENLFKGACIRTGSEPLRMLFNYKANFPDSYREIMELLFRPHYGAGVTHIKTESAIGQVFAEDAKEISSEVSSEFSPISMPRCTERHGLYSAISAVRKMTDAFSYGRQAEFALNDLIEVRQPWSGYYETAPGLWLAAQITHFTGTSWKFVKSIPSEMPRVSHAAFMSDSGNYTLIFVNDSDNDVKYNICVRNIEKADAVLYCVETAEPEKGCDKTSRWFRVTDKVIPARGKSGFFYRLDIKPHSVLTCTTLNVGRVSGIDSVRKCAYAPGHLGLPYCDPFSSEDDALKVCGGLPKYSSETSGSFMVFGTEDGFVLEQTSTKKGSLYDEAVLSIGDQCWSNYSVKTEAHFENTDKENFIGVGLRFGSGSGYRFRVYPDGRWQLMYRDTAAAEGKDAPVNAEEWNTLKISARHNSIRCTANRQIVCEYFASEPMTPAGRACLCSALETNKFKRITINPVMGDACFCAFEDCFSENIKYGDGWIKSRNFVYTKNKNAVFEYDFFGTTAALIGRTENLRLKIEIDDKIMTAGYFIDKCGLEQAFYYKSRLPEQPHKIKVTVLSGRLYLSGVASDEWNDSGKNSRLSGHKKDNGGSSRKLRKSTLFIGAGFAAAGTAALIINKIFGKRKK